MDLTTLTLIGVLGLLLGAGLAAGWARRAPSQVQTSELTALKEQLATHIAQLQAKEEQTLEMRQQREQVQRELGVAATRSGIDPRTRHALHRT